MGQYEGQSWKNVISIGDSDFERIGTIRATTEYLKQQGIVSQDEPALPASPSRNRSPTRQAEIRGHLYRVRTKTFKIVDQPTVDELIVQLEMLPKWLPLMVTLDNGFDVEFNALDDLAQLGNIEAILQ